MLAIKATLSRNSAAFLTFLLLLRVLRAGGNCGLYGCTLSLSYTCSMDFYEGSFFPELAESFEDNQLTPTGAGCAANHEMIVCPFSGKNKNMMIAWRMAAQFESWNVSASHLLNLPSVDVSGNIYFSDGYALYGYNDVGDPLGKKIVLFPETGPLFDMTIVSDQFLYLLYKSGFMVAYFTDGSPYASVWLNSTIDGRNGTFVPLSNPAVSGQRVYFLAKFVPFMSYPPGHMNTVVRLYAIDVRMIMVERIKVIWYNEYNMVGTPAPLDSNSSTTQDIARVVIQKNTVVGMLNYVVIPEGSNTTCMNKDCNLHTNRSKARFGSKSLIMSIQDEGDAYKENFLNDSQPPFQAVAFVDPTITSSSEKLKSVPAVSDPPELWVSWCGEDSYSVIGVMNSITGASKPMMTKIPSLTNISLTTKMTIFYNDNQGNGVKGKSASATLMPLVFGYTTTDDDAYLAAVDVSGSEPELRWSLKLPGNVPAVGQVTTTGLGRDTMMFATTGKGAYFYELFSDDIQHH